LSADFGDRLWNRPASSSFAQLFGVDARVATWPDFDEGHFDAVLFTRSLHHIHPLDESVRHAADRLVKGRRIIVEDFGYESTDKKTLHWFSSGIRLLEATGLLTVSDEFLDKMLSKTETLKAWRQNHEDELHTAAEIDAQLETFSDRVIRENSAYYFRYIANAIIATRSATRSFKLSPSKKKRWRPTAPLLHLAGGLWRRKLDNCEISLAAPSASRYLSIQFFASLKKVDRRKKSRANREQLRCCNWIRLPYGPIPENFRG
jgi:SAM-dependent methyltransferase